jgi:hypothetical protein
MRTDSALSLTRFDGHPPSGVHPRKDVRSWKARGRSPGGAVNFLDISNGPWLRVVRPRASRPKPRHPGAGIAVALIDHDALADPGGAERAVARVPDAGGAAVSGRLDDHHLTVQLTTDVPSK